MIRRLVAVLAASVLCLVAAPPAAQAAARVAVSGQDGQARASATGSTRLTLSGSGFQSIPRGMGGIYVFFGTVDDVGGGSWKPSRGGVSGADFTYIPDSESADNQGYQRFVTFPGSETGEAANGGEIAADGTWSTTLLVPGPVITVTGREGRNHQVDCRTSTCGVITVGAHGIKNATNETFTPIGFAAAPAAAAAASPSSAGPVATTGAAAQASTPPGPSAAAAAPAGQEPTVGVERASAVVGRVLAFTARGFAPGEQVTAVLSDGQAAVGPLVAGSQGEVASVLQLPRDLRPGTHTLRVTGAASGATASTDFVVTVSVQAVPDAGTGTAAPSLSLPWVAVIVAALLLLFVLLTGLFGAWHRRRAARRGAPTTGRRRRRNAGGNRSGSTATPPGSGGPSGSASDGSTSDGSTSDGSGSDGSTSNGSAQAGSGAGAASEASRPDDGWDTAAGGSTAPAGSDRVGAQPAGSGPAGHPVVRWPSGPPEVTGELPRVEPAAVSDPATAPRPGTDATIEMEPVRADR